MSRFCRLVLTLSLAFCAAAASAQESTAASGATASAPLADTAINTNYRAEPEWMPKRDPEKGLVILFRESRFVGGGVAYKLFYEGTQFPKLKNGSFVYAYLEPGDYALYADKKKRRDARLLGVEPGEVYFFEASLVVGAFKSGIDLLPTEPEIAMQRMAELKKPVPAKKK